MGNDIKEIHADYNKIDTDQMIEVDRLMTEEYHIDLVQMMENAGRCLAVLLKEQFFDGDVEGKRIVVMAGSGGNGGSALVAARRLHNWGARVQVFTTSEAENFTPVPKHQYSILERMGVSIALADKINEVGGIDAMLDGIIGYSLHGDPRGLAASMIQWANTRDIPLVALDTPSGLDLTSRKLHDPIIKATATLTLAMPKIGLFSEEARATIGELYLGDISVPNELYQEKTLGLKPSNIFRYYALILKQLDTILPTKIPVVSMEMQRSKLAPTVLFFDVNESLLDLENLKN